MGLVAELVEVAPVVRPPLKWAGGKRWVYSDETRRTWVTCCWNASHRAKALKASLTKNTLPPAATTNCFGPMDITD